jgi:hypothetical protein
MGTYWEKDGPHQAAYDRLHEELVPSAGAAETLEGEMLRAAGGMGYEFYNNGGGNNVSGNLIFLRDNMPGFDPEWWAELAPYVSGATSGSVSPGVCDTVEEVLDAVVVHVDSLGGRYTPSPGDMRHSRVERTGLEEEAYEDDAEDEDYLDNDDGEDDEEEATFAPGR